MATELALRIGSQIKELREAAGLTQAKLAAKVGKTTLSISNIERGRALPGLATLEAVAIALEVSLRDLLPDTASVAASEICDPDIASDAQLSRLRKSDRSIIDALVGFMLSAERK